MLWFLALGHYDRLHLYAESCSFLPLFCPHLFLLTVWSFPWVLSLGSQEGLCSKDLICIFFPLLLPAMRNFKPTSPSHPPLLPHFLPNQRRMQMLASVIFPCEFLPYREKCLLGSWASVSCLITHSKGHTTAATACLCHYNKDIQGQIPSHATRGKVAMLKWPHQSPTPDRCHNHRDHAHAPPQPIFCHSLFRCQVCCVTLPGET